MPIDVRPPLLKRRRTKIVATLGPASSATDTIARLIASGVDVFRLNMSHGSHDEHAAMCAAVRSEATRADRPVAVLADLCGPKIRTGTFPDGSIELRQDETVRVVAGDREGGAGLLSIAYARLTTDARPGHRLLIDDGKLDLEVAEVTERELRCVVRHGGTLRDRKGVNFPDTPLSVSALTTKDREDAAFARRLGVDYLALSFVRRAADVRELRQLLEPHDAVRLVAKIEKPEALENAEDILRAADAIMVARGDLGVEMPPETVPAAQDSLVAMARAHHKPVIIATQMLESMLHDARPTRAEVSDIAHAVTSGTDAVMLSGETAVGAHPIGAVQMMDRIVRQTEAGLWAGSAFSAITANDPREDAPRGTPLHANVAVARAVSQMSRDLAVRAILVVSHSGTSGMVVSSLRPAAPLLTVTACEETCRVMNLFWGVFPRQVEAAAMADPVPLVREIARETGLAQPGQAALIVRGFRDHPDRNLPTVTVVRI
ncbi:MAG: pyruvate kinase [Planctomycetota bacterium]